MTKAERTKKIKELRAAANRMEESVSGNAGPSSQEWVSSERRSHYFQMANEKRQEADKLERMK